MEAEVVDPEEERTAHYDYNAVREKLRALDPEALAAAEAMFEEDDDGEPATNLAPQGPPRGPVARSATPGVPQSPPHQSPPHQSPPQHARPQPHHAPPQQAQPGAYAPPGSPDGQLDDDDDDPATEIVGDDELERIRAAMNAKIEQAMGLPTIGDDFDEDEPTRVADPGQMDAAMQMLAEREAALMARSAGPPPSRRSAPRATPSAPTPQPGSAAPPIPAPAAQHPAAQHPAAPHPAAQHPAAQHQVPGGPAPAVDDPESQDLVQLLAQQRRRDTLMYVLAALLFAIGIGVWLMNQ